ncbi:MAG: amidohydrolase family protein [Gammaproteobacteria bacterium]|nr:amidohydrolase family protein [Gammaproteobacteria bacterium]
MKLLPLALIFLSSAINPVVSAAQPETSEEAENKWDVSHPGYSVEATIATIDVSEGTWMSLDVAPDGNSIVFDLLGDIYRIPFAGGKAESLLSGHAWEMQPRFSPDGGAIAFTSDRAGGENIWIMNLENRDLHQVTFEDFRLLNNPSWSPDGDYLAARKHFTTSRSLGVGEIWIYHTRGEKGSKGVPVVERPDPTFQKELGEPMYAPTGDVIYYSQNSTPGNTFIYHQNSNQEIFQIKKVDLKTGETSKVVGGPGGAVRPTPSPDGKTIAYVKRVRALSRLFIMDLTSGEETMLVDHLDQDMQETWGVQGMYPNMDWTPDNKQVVYWSEGKLWRVDVDTLEKVNIPFQVSDTRSIYPVPLFRVDVAPDNFSTKMIRFARRSPDDNSIVFESLGRLYVKNGDNEPEPLTTDKNGGFEFSPVWSPNGNKIYFLRWHDEELASIRSVSNRGGRSSQLNTAPGQYTELSISQDGKTLAYRKLGGSNLLSSQWGQAPGNYLLDIKTQETHFVSKQGLAPRLSTDNAVLYTLERKQPSGRDSDTAKTQLLSMTRDGHNVKVVAESEFATDIQLSPDGKTIAFQENHHIYLSAFPKTGKTIALGPKQKGLPSKQVSNIGGTYIHWSSDSKRLSWSVGPQLMTVNTPDVLFEEEPNTDAVNLSISIQADVPSGELALTGARIVTMDAERTVIENGTIVISRNRITEIGPTNETTIPDDASVIELPGKTIIPGLIDIHAHGAYGDGQIIPQQNWNSLAHLALGVTTLHNPSSTATQAFAAAEYARAGKILSPRIFSTGEIVYGAKSTSWVPVDSLEDALSHIRRLKAQGAISIKNYNQPRRDQRQQVIEAARAEGIMSVAEGGSLFHLDMNLIADGITGIEHNVPTLVMYDDITQFWRQSGAGYTPTLVVTYGGLTSEDYFYQHTEVWKHPILSRFVPPTVLQPRAVRREMAPESDYKDDDSAASAKVLMEAGVMVNIGAHGQREGLASHWEMWSFVRGGMSPMQALTAATINPATYLAMDGDLGSIEVGKLADLVILDANPLTDIRNSDKVGYVVLNGRVYESGTLAEVTTGDRKLKPFWWQGKPQSEIR